jgi:glycine/D-amino acid oxidase-like deaminating enzyme
MRDRIVIGGGPVGAAAAMFLAEQEAEKGPNEATNSVLCLYDPRDRGAHEDWSRLARLSFDADQGEFELSKHALELLEMMDEVRANMSGAPVLPVKPGMCFVASPGSNMARALTNGESFNDPDFVRRSPDELADVFPGNEFNLPPDTMCWTHDKGYCVSPIELADTLMGVSRSYGAECVGDRVVEVSTVPLASGGEDGMVYVRTQAGAIYATKRLFVFAGAQGKELIAASPNMPAVPELDQLYITGISTVRYKHKNHPANPAPGSGHVVQPIILGQLDVPDIVAHQTNFSVVPEEYGDVLKTRLSGAAGQEVIDTVADLHREGIQSQDAELAVVYGNLFGRLFPHLETENALDFNRCVTYRNHFPQFSGTSLLHSKPTPESDLLVTPGCYGVGVKFGPALGQSASQFTVGEDLEVGMNVFESGTLDLEGDGERIERAW